MFTFNGYQNNQTDKNIVNLMIPHTRRDLKVQALSVWNGVWFVFGGQKGLEMRTLTMGHFQDY